jgi:hypothetical protein
LPAKAVNKVGTIAGLEPRPQVKFRLEMGFSLRFPPLLWDFGHNFSSICLVFLMSVRAVGPVDPPGTFFAN